MPFRRFPARRTTTVAKRRTTTRRRIPYQKFKYVMGHRAASGRVPYISPNPKTQLAKMRFSLNAGLGHAIASSSGAVVDWVYRANDGYDPYAGAGGAQPRNFDQLMAMYRHGVCVRSTINLEFFFDAVPSYAMKVGVLLRDSTTSLGAASQADITESPRRRDAILDPQLGGVRKIRFTYTPKGFFGTKDCEDNEELFFTSGASPSQNAAYHVFGYGMASQTQQCYVTGWIDYTFLLLHPIQPSQS